MWFQAELYAYDALSSVQVSARVVLLGDTPPHRPVTVLRCATTIDGVGETSAEEWLKDALVGLLETL